MRRRLIACWHDLWRGRDPSGAQLGRRGERYAARWLRRRGHRVLERNLHVPGGEADLLVLDPDGVTLAVVEVKTRADDRPPPEASIGATKQRRLTRVARHLQTRDRYARRPMRFDAVAVVWPPGSAPRVRHHVGAFEARGDG